MSTPILDLAKLDPNIEIILRAGTVQDPNAPKTLAANYARPDPLHPGVFGISVVLHPGYDVDQLTLHNQFRHPKVSYAKITAVYVALQQVGYEMILFITPDLPKMPDHHTLAVRKPGEPIEMTLPDVVGNALITHLHVVDNPHRYP